MAGCFIRKGQTNRRASFTLKTAVGEKYSGISTGYTAFAGANSFAHKPLFVIMNSHPQTRQPRFSG
jgi:hypothetical protein